MPTYDYECATCNSTEEVLKSFSQMDREEKCSKCSTIMKRLISGGSGFVFKGGGTIKTTFRDKYGKRKTENASTPTEAAQAKASEAQKQMNHSDMMKKDPYYNDR